MSVNPSIFFTQSLISPGGAEVDQLARYVSAFHVTSNDLYNEHLGFKHLDVKFAVRIQLDENVS